MRFSFLVIIMPISLASMISCSDFFKRKTIEINNQQGGATPSLPTKAEADPDACKYNLPDLKDSRQQLLFDLSAKNICPKVADFRHYVTLLRLSVDQACINAKPQEQQKDFIFMWTRLIESFEYLVAVPFGPLSAQKKQLLNEIYSWPDFNKHAIKSELLKASTQGSEYKMNLAPSRKGLAAIELLIANDQALLSPGPGKDLKLTEIEFNARSLHERQKARCIVLKELIKDLSVQAEQLYQAWSAKSGKYPLVVLDQIRSGRSQMLLNEVSDALFYLEKVKDYKLGLPLGLNTRCVSEKCPEDVEFFATGLSITALKINLKAFNQLMNNQEGSNFSILLNELGRVDLADQLKSKLDQINLKMTEVEKSGKLNEQINSLDKSVCGVDSKVSICALYFAVKDVMAFYKSEVLSALDLQQPVSESDGD